MGVDARILFKANHTLTETEMRHIECDLEGYVFTGEEGISYIRYAIPITINPKLVCRQTVQKWRLGSRRYWI